MIVAVGSTNPTKIKPVKKIFSKHFDDVKVVGVQVESGVRDQPLNLDEVFKGALNRAKKALDEVKNADFGVGIEAGTHKHNFGWLESSLVVIVNEEGKIGIGSASGIVLPREIVEDLEKGKTIDDSIERVFGIKKIGRGVGMFGLLSKGVVTRSEAVEHGVAFALARFFHENLY